MVRYRKRKANIEKTPNETMKKAVKEVVTNGYTVKAEASRKTRKEKKTRSYATFELDTMGLDSVRKTFGRQIHFSVHNAAKLTWIAHAV